MNPKKATPERTCVGCRKKYNQADLLAITRKKDGTVQVNPGKKAAGRSVYLCLKPKCLSIARDRKGQNALQFGLKSPISPVIWAELEKIIKLK